MHIALITAGGAGMFCGSCMHDNTLARALRGIEHEVSLIPCYTPIRLDERDVSERRVFLGGINVYLDALVPGWSRLPRPLTRWLDSPALLRFVGRFAINSSAKKLSKLTISLLNGDHGAQRREIEEFADFIGKELRPDVVCFSNALLAGMLPRLRQSYVGPLVCLLQGDDIFLEDLAEPFRRQAIELVSRLARLFDGFLVHSAYYRDFMADYLSLPRDRMHVVPLGIDLAGHDGKPKPTAGESFTIGYFARICPEKGLHRLVEAFRLLHARHPRTRLVAGGYLGARHKEYFQQIARAAADLGAAFEYVGSPPGHDEKVQLLQSFDLLSVPTEYREPKGLYVLEALANGVPLVLPRHGAFPELIEGTGGGLLVEPNDPSDLARALEDLLLVPQRRFELAKRGWETVHSRYDSHTMAQTTIAALNSVSPPLPT